MARKKKKVQPGLLVENRKARHDYEILEDYEAGLSLQGSEVKSIRDGKASLAEAFCAFVGDELYLQQAHIAEYTQAHARNHDPLRKRKLLMHRHQLDALKDKVKLQGVTLVPLSMYVKDRRIKLAIGVAKGKKLHDKRASIKEKDQKREMDRARREGLH